MRRFIPFLCLLGLLSPIAAHATQFSLGGYVYCDLTGLPLSGVTIHATATSGSPFTSSATTDANGYYELLLQIGGGEYQATIDLTPDETVIFPSSGAYLFTTDLNDLLLFKNWVIASPRCSKPSDMCWLTGGGAKFSQDLNIPVAEYGRRHNFGGNVYPGCSSTAGDGGQWNHLDVTTKRHFQGFHIHVDRCGNVDGIPPGSDSPKTPFNFIEFSGTGRVQGVKGNKEQYDLVYFTARCEDRNEPGSSGAKAGALVDRYFLHVYTDPLNRAATTLILVDADGDANTQMDGVPITDGNLQIHISSCDSPPASLALRQPEASSASAPRNEFWFASAPNPVVDFARIRFGVPKDADVAFRVFDVTGRMVRQISNERVTAGDHSTGWDLRDLGGNRVSRGLYFLQMRMNGMSRVQRIVVP
jgi:hypothetical protein